MNTMRQCTVMGKGQKVQALGAGCLASIALVSSRQCERECGAPQVRTRGRRRAV